VELDDHELEPVGAVAHAVAGLLRDDEGTHANSPAVEQAPAPGGGGSQRGHALARVVVVDVGVRVGGGVGADVDEEVVGVGGAVWGDDGVNPNDVAVPLGLGGGDVERVAGVGGLLGRDDVGRHEEVVGLHVRVGRGVLGGGHRHKGDLPESAARLVVGEGGLPGEAVGEDDLGGAGHDGAVLVVAGVEGPLQLDIGGLAVLLGGDELPVLAGVGEGVKNPVA